MQRIHFSHEKVFCTISFEIVLKTLGRSPPSRKEYLYSPVCPKNLELGAYGSVLGKKIPQIQENTSKSYAGIVFVYFLFLLLTAAGFSHFFYSQIFMKKIFAKK
jgi:hypothetical protein